MERGLNATNQSLLALAWKRKLLPPPGCAKPNPNRHFGETTLTLKSIPPESLYTLIRQGAMPDIIDVRTAAEFSELHIDGAQLFPLTSFRPEQVMACRQGRHEETLYVVCKTGSRAEVACRKFYDAGFHNVVNVGAAR